jgi:hypothetical protein
MAMVIRAPQDEMKKAYLSDVWEICRKNYSIKCGILTQDVLIKVKDRQLLLKRGDYVMFYGEKRDLVEDLGVKLKNKGYKVLLIDEITIGLLSIL